MPILSVLIFFPMLAGLLVLPLDKDRPERIKAVALAVAVSEFLLSLPLWSSFDKTTHLMQFVERHRWIEPWNVQYALGVDGISVLFVLLTTLLTVLCILVSWRSVTEKPKEFFVALLFLEGTIVGVFCALDLFLFYIFWEAMLIPMFLIIGIWGGPRRLYATVKFFLYTLVGSLLMLVGIIVLYRAGGNTFDILALAENQYPIRLQLVLFWAFFAAFAVKVPMWPVHTWLPDAHTEAPTAGSVILAGILIKMGAYGFLRFSMPLFPDATRMMMEPMMILSIIGIIYGGLICISQSDIKRLIAYSSVSHMGFVTLGLFSLNTQGVEGGILQMINHGIVTGALFLAIGIVYERTHSRAIADYGGLASVMPVFAGFFMLFTLAAIGLPGTNGFVGEFLVLLGAFSSRSWAAVFAATGLIVGAWYMLWLYQRVFFNPPNPGLQGIAAINGREIAVLVPLAALILVIGFVPNLLLDYMHVSVAHLLARIPQAEPAATGPLHALAALLP